MDGRNSAGRRISLLNDDGYQRSYGAKESFSPWSNSFQYPRDPTTKSGRRILALPEYHRSHSSVTSISDPPTPQLVRSDSTDSAGIQRTPSPLTPNLGLERLSIMSGSGGQPHYSSALPKAAYPELELADAAAPQPYRPLFAPQVPTSASQNSSYSRSSPSQSSPSAPERPAAPQASASFRSRRAPVKSSKNTYPCPLGHQFNCDRYFTTSGHAARHAKIHSGEKNIVCPDCDKRFARKDNMDQHRKTHRRGGASSDADSPMSTEPCSDSVLEMTSSSITEERQKADLKAGAKLRRARKRSMRSPEPFSLHGLTSSDESLNTLPTTGSESSYSGGGSNERVPSFDAENSRKRSSSSSNSLDVLANIATSRLAEHRPTLGRRAVFLGLEHYDSETESS